MSVSITNKTKKRAPKGNFSSLGEYALGEKYELSLVFCGDALSKKLNSTYRGKDKPTNVLSFPISKNSGEIFINLNRLKGFSALYLYIHGLCHLKGMEHGDRMEKAEKKLLNVASNRRWN